MHKHGLPHVPFSSLRKPAIGQSIVIPLSINASVVQEVDRNELVSVAVYKSEFKRQKPYIQFPGGMLEEGQTFEEAAIAELKQETNIIVQPRHLVSIYEGKKKQIGFPGSFTVKLFIALDCDFSVRFDPGKDESGEDGEIPVLVKLGDIKPEKRWEIPTLGPRRASFLPQQLSMLKRMEQEIFI